MSVDAPVSTSISILVPLTFTFTRGVFVFAESPSMNTRPHCCHLAADMAVMKPGGPVMVAVIGVAAMSLVIDRP